MVIRVRGKNNYLLIFLPLILGGIVSIFIDTSLYSEIIRPRLSPPSFLFPIVWSILYLLMGVSLNMVLKTNDGSKDAISFFVIQLFLNYTWSNIFFNLRAYLLASIWIIVLLISIILMINSFRKINKLASFIQIPYLLWVMFASYLTIAIYILNG